MFKFSAAKFYVALATPLGILANALRDGVFTNDERAAFALACLVAALVYFTPNKPVPPADPPQA